MKRTTFEPDTLAGRLQVYFEANPDEELTTQDICDKFGAASSSTVNKALSGKPQFKSEMTLMQVTPKQKAWVLVWRYER